MRVWQMQDDRFDAGLNANLDTGSVKILFAIFAGTKVITKPDVAHQAPQYLQPLLAFVPKAS
jgi:hypothetical protein